MEHINLADAQAHFHEIVDRVEAGEVMDITRQGKPIARLSPATPPRKKIDFEALRRMRERQTASATPVHDFIRQMRDSDRY